MTKASHLFIENSWGGNGRDRIDTGEVCRYCGLQRIVKSTRNSLTGKWERHAVYPNGEHDCNNTYRSIELGTL